MFKLEDAENLPEESLIFGYGSLMFPKGINGRGLSHVYKEHNELQPYMLEGFQRTMSAEWLEKALRFYGLAKSDAYSTFGVLIPIHRIYDLKALLYNEAAYPVWSRHRPMYETWDITDEVAENARGDQRVFTLLCETREVRPEWHAPGYVDYVYKHLPKSYRELFLATGGLQE